MMKSNEKRSVIAGLYGNALEWYDFLLYASFAPLFARLFFPANEAFVSLIATFSVFAIGFLMRPIGGMLLGHLADHAGRRKALIVSVTTMTAATALIAVLPGYHQLGIWAPVLFSLLRMIQGLAVGGELPGSATFLIEHMFANRRGFAGSLVLSTAFLGIFTGSLTASLLSAIFSYEMLYHWGWRLAYLLGAVLGMFGIYLRLKSVESPSFLKQVKPSSDWPVKLIFTQYRKPLLLAVIFTSIMALGNYILIAYVTTFLVRMEHFVFHEAVVINFIALFFLTLLIPLMGWLSDVVGRKPVFLTGLAGLLLFIFPVFSLLLSGHWGKALLAELLLSAVLAPLNATVPTILAEMFPTSVRASGTSIGYNIGQAVFGGTLPLVALTLTEITGNHYAPAWYVLIWVLLVLISSRYLKETYRKDLE
nr:MFS transporter [Legionella israelensis]